MKEHTMKNPLSIKLIYWMVNGSFWFLLIGLLALIGDQLLYLLNITEDTHFTFSMPLRRDLLPISEVEIAGVLRPVKIKSITGGFNSWDFGIQFVLIKNIALLTNAILILYSLRVIIKMLNNVKLNTVFVFENVKYLKTASYLFFSVWIIKDIFLQSYVQISFTYFNPINNLFMDYLLSTHLLIASILLAIAYIFEHGVKLRNYKDLTI